MMHIALIVSLCVSSVGLADFFIHERPHEAIPLSYRRPSMGKTNHAKLRGKRRCPDCTHAHRCDWCAPHPTGKGRGKAAFFFARIL